MMQVVLSTPRRDHIFDLARQLEARDHFAALFTGYPMFKLRGESLPTEKIRTFPYLQTLYMARGKFGIRSTVVEKHLDRWVHETLDRYSARNLPPCDVFYGFATCTLKTGRLMQQRGGVYVCDRPNSHIRYQEEILRDEFTRHGIPYSPIDPYRVAREEAEYDAADLVVVPSSYAKRTFIEMGVPENKVAAIPYGVDLTRFHPVAAPNPKRFDVLFVGALSLRKGIPYLLDAFERISHPNKHLTLVGTAQPETHKLLTRAAAHLPITLTGHCPQDKLKDIMSRSHIAVLPSIEDGFGLVMAQAMACGCPVIATKNTGGEDLFEDGSEGYVIPIRDTDALADRMQRLASDFDRQRAMAKAALRRVQSLGGWDAYGAAMTQLFSELVGKRKAVHV